MESIAGASLQFNDGMSIKEESDICHSMPETTKCGDVLRTHQCDGCLLLFKTWDELRLHKKSHPREKRRQICDRCDMKFSKKDYLRKHMLKVHNVVLEKGRCGRKSKFKNNDNDPKPFKCSECVREFAKYKPYNRHLKTHQKRYCNFCQDYVQMYAEHMKKVHNFEVPRNFVCDICERTYRNKSDIVMHMKVHIHMIENRTYACKMCDRTFYFNHDLTRHMKVHSTLRPVICEICGEKFKTSETLKTHMRRHTGEKPFVCTFCPRKFSTSGSLNIHVRTHTNERPHQCNICHKAFKDASTMNVHLRQHSGEQPYVCAMCGRRTKQASNLRSHYRHFHKNTEISGRQIRLNSRVFARYTQEQLDEHLRTAGDLMALLAKGMEEYQAEENARNIAQEQLLERLGLGESQKTSADTLNAIANANNTDFNHPEDFHVSKFRCEPKLKIESKSNAIIKNEDEFALTESMEIDILHPPLNIYDEKPPIPLSFDQEPKIESVFVDVFTGEPNTMVPDIKTEDIEYEYEAEVSCTPNNGSGAAFYWLTYQPEDAKNESVVPVEPEVTVVVDQNNDINLSHKFDWNRENSSDSQPSVERLEEIEKSVENTEKNKKISKRNKPVQKPPTKINVYNPRKSICFTCGIEYKNRDAHLQSYHSEVQRPYECFICHRNYKKLYAVRQHMMTHSNARNTICHICGNAYFNNSDLKKHILSAHTTERPHKCQKCGKAFKTHYGMLVHERSHSGVKPFRCNMCLESFSAVTSLRTHERRHTGEKPFVCKFCGKGFSDSSTHRQHERVHTGEKPYACHLCGRRTVQAGNLKSHYRHYHKIIVKNVSMYVEQVK